MCFAASLFESRDFVIERLPASAEHVSTSDDNINLLSSGSYRAPNLADPLRQRRQSSGKSGRNGGDIDVGAFERTQSSLDKCVIHTYGCHLEVEVLKPELLHNGLLHWLTSLCAETQYALLGVITGKSSQIHAGDGAQQPRCLPFLLHRTTSHQALRAALYRAGVDLHVGHPVDIERHATIRL